MKNICTYNYILTSGKISDSMIEERSNCTEYCGYPEYKGDGYCQGRRSNQCHRAMALVDFLPRKFASK